MRRVIFLDVDGVLNTYGTPSSSLANWKYIEEDLTKNLEYIIDKTDADIVISSSWCEEAIELLKTVDFKHIGKVVGVTPRQKRWRGEQIMQWIEENADINNIAFVVIDDEDFDICGEACSVIPEERFVQTSFKEGLIKEKAEEVINKLRRQYEQNRKNI